MLLLGIIMIAQQVRQKIDRRHTCNVPLWLNVLMKVRFDKGEPLLDAALDVSASLTDVTEH